MAMANETSSPDASRRGRALWSVRSKHPAAKSVSTLGRMVLSTLREHSAPCCDGTRLLRDVEDEILRARTERRPRHDRRLVHARLREVAHAAREDRLEAGDLVGRERGLVVLRVHRLQLTLEHFCPERARRLMARGRKDRGKFRGTAKPACP